MAYKKSKQSLPNFFEQQEKQEQSEKLDRIEQTEKISREQQLAKENEKREFDLKAAKEKAQQDDKAKAERKKNQPGSLLPTPPRGRPMKRVTKNPKCPLCNANSEWVRDQFVSYRAGGPDLLFQCLGSCGQQFSISL